MRRYLPYISGLILLLLTLVVEQAIYYTPNVESDKATLTEMMRQDELSVIQSINHINDNVPLDQIGKRLEELPDYLAFSFADASGVHLSWKGNLGDCQVIRSKQLPNAHILSIGWDLLDQDGVMDIPLQLSQSYKRAGSEPEFLLEGNIESVSIKSGSANQRPYLPYLISILYTLSFFFILKGLSAEDLKITTLGIPIVYVIYYVINSRFLTDVSIYHDTSLMLNPWAPSLANIILLTVALYVYFLKGIKKYSPNRQYLSLAVEAISVTGLLIGILISLYQFINSPAVRINFNELSTLSSVEVVSLTCIVSWTILLFMRTQLLIRETNVLSGTVKYGSFAVIALLTMILAGIPTNLTPIWILPIFIIVYFILSDLYYDIGARNITWLILWLVVMSAFLSTILYKYDFDRDIKNRTVALDSYFQSVDNERLKVYKQEHKQKFPIIKSNIESHPQPGQIDGIDMVESTFNTIDHTTIALSAYAQDSSTIYTRQEDLPVGSELWTELGDGWLFEPVDHIYRKVDMIKTDTDTITHYTDYLNYAYAKYVDIPITIIKDGHITSNGLNLTEDDVIKLMATDKEKAYIDSELYIIHRPIEGYIAVTAKPIFSILKPVTLFSFFFCLLTVLVIFFMSSNGKLDFLPEFLPLRFSKDTGLSTRIQLIIVGMVIFSFIAIATITSVYLQSQIANNSNQQTQNRIRAISNSMLWHLQSIDQSKNTAYFLDNIRLELEEVHNVGIQLYHSNGQNVSNASEYIPYLAYHHFQQDQLSSPLTFKEGNHEISYIPFKSGKTEEQIYASVSHQIPRSATLGVVDYLGTLLNIYVFLFLIAGAVALAIARSITEPLETLANRMKETKLNKKNIPVEWKADDEIGKLINNYNSMINELEDSAQLIARTERDGAWKEMARNVAHEIKNPLTPMKLSIQYLERAVKQKPTEAESLVNRISNTLIEQIDNLAKIADAFSNFGQMPQANNEKIILNDIVETIHDLFRKRDDMTIKMSEPIEDLLIFADRNHLVSILNNLLKNAIQSIPNDREGNISIDLYKEEGNAIIKVSDNGIGIPEEMKDKIFTPNFTTKSSGSGLGLAISSNMIEAFNGRMYFESIAGVGSKFYISIPLMKHFVDSSDTDLLMLDD